MPTWDANQYLRFGDQRTRPCEDLVKRITLDGPRTVIDLGCGPGNSTATLARRWPDSKICGIDSSEEMITAARAGCATREYAVREISNWAQSGQEIYDLVFSNAALQWVENHQTLLSQLLKHVAPGGALAIQMPGNINAAAHQIMRELAGSDAWRGKLAGAVREWHVHDLPFYYDILAPQAVSVDLWESEYIHVMDNAEAIVQWYKGTGLRPFLDALKSEGDARAFEMDYSKRIAEAYPAQKDGRVLFPFRRLFLVAYR